MLSNFELIRRRWLLDAVGVEYPVIQAPMAGGPSTPELAAAVSNAGGLGSLGLAYSTPDGIRSAIRRTKALTRQAFAVNLFAGQEKARKEIDPRPMLELLAEVHRAFDIPPPALPVAPQYGFEDQLAAVLEERPAVFSFTFGIPGEDALKELKTRGIVVIGTATTVKEAYLLEASGVDAIVAQGAEAGAHRGTFAGSFEASIEPAAELTRQTVATVGKPVVASGGIMDGREIAAMLALGASAVQLGTAFVVCPESGASETYKQALLAAREDKTVVTRAYSGRPARGIENEFISLLAGREERILPYPLQNELTRPMRAEAARKGKAGFLSLWAGTGVARARAMPAAELVRTLVQEMREP